MTLKVSCSRCGETLYNGDMQPLEEILQLLHFQCSNCKRKINPEPKTVLINGKELRFKKPKTFVKLKST